ncbi:cytochrome P450 2J1-like [Chaetodon trifascialis]|uniref:cytochrome P450 2J1-like n=1 Tax=Chaetodon trifascialis TaxID=109706 RepID=UPI0039929B26
MAGTWRDWHFIHIMFNHNPPYFPPGPFPLPFVGNVFSLADIYGNVFNVRLGGDKLVFVSGYKMVKEAIVAQAENFVDRPYSPMMDRFYSGTKDGLFMSNSEVWKTQRRFALSTLRSFGLGKSSLEQSICEEIRHLREEIEKEKETDLGFTETNLALCSLDLFLAGTETTSTTLLWALVFLIKHPDIQAMADRANLPYTDAVIHEIQRVGNIVPLSAPRMAAKDTTLGGYFIPKGTSIMPNLTSVLFDKTEWETPDSFNPGHFLNAEGKFVKREAFLPFSAGKRVCLGEGLAKMELFLFLVGLLQKFSFSIPDGVELSTEGITGSTRVPHPYKVYAKAR